jgi:VanZ family protein
MNEAKRKQIIFRVVSTTLTVAMMIVIFFFSTEPAEQSDRTSGIISEQVIRVTHPDFQEKTEAEQNVIFEHVQHSVRKTAHFTEYMVLGLLIRICLESWFGTRKWSIPVSWMAGALYACSDELHQILIDGRSGQWTDVLLDSAGVLVGVLLASLIIFFVGRNIRGKQDGVLSEQPAE